MGAFITRLSEDYRTIVLGGAKLGIAALLEARGGAAGYLGMGRNLMVEAKLLSGSAWCFGGKSRGWCTAGRC
jgi:hypothetical protein